MRSNWIICYFMNNIFGVITKKSLCKPGSQKYSLMFTSRNCTVLVLYLGPWYFQLILVHIVTYESKFTFLHMDVQMLQYNFSSALPLHLLQKSIFMCVGLFLDIQLFNCANCIPLSYSIHYYSFIIKLEVRQLVLQICVCFLILRLLFCLFCSYTRSFEFLYEFLE